MIGCVGAAPLARPPARPPSGLLAGGVGQVAWCADASSKFIEMAKWLNLGLRESNEGRLVVSELRRKDPLEILGSSYQGGIVPATVYPPCSLVSMSHAVSSHSMHKGHSHNRKRC